MKNNLTQENDVMAKSHVIYEIKCTVGDWDLRNPTYIGHTRNNVRARLNQHRRSGAIMEHLPTYHTRLSFPFDEVQQNVTNLKMLTETNKLFIYEALSILDKKQDYTQIGNFINPLKLFSRGTTNIPQPSYSTNNISTSLSNCMVECS